MPRPACNGVISGPCTLVSNGEGLNPLAVMNQGARTQNLDARILRGSQNPLSERQYSLHADNMQCEAGSANLCRVQYSVSINPTPERCGTALGGTAQLHRRPLDITAAATAAISGQHGEDAGHRRSPQHGEEQLGTTTLSASIGTTALSASSAAGTCGSTALSATSVGRGLVAATSAPLESAAVPRRTLSWERFPPPFAWPWATGGGALPPNISRQHRPPCSFWR